ncbi:M3 family oligoendopeptidase [Nitrosospira sp. Nsp13]|uniref:M3 family oligoendopeptidase n=1 Tax=Nitrosospira sp. Nsp13 TaxID=1855332 RepID=UPI00088195CB|nr:M3 family metallopeptidase [Nitrosospira sp. Nsp13]SCX87633.1 Oligoendopeptidase F [Nitrosospira sp. Nsp13]
MKTLSIRKSLHYSFWRHLFFSTRCCAITLIFVLYSGKGVCAESPFVPIPEAKKPLYQFNFKNLFYSDDLARQNDLSELQILRARLVALKSEASTKPARLLEAIELKQRMGIIADRLWAYGGLRLATNTQNTVFQKEAQEGEDARSDFDSSTVFVQSIVQDLNDEKMNEFIAVAPGLVRYKFLLESWRRTKPHTPPEAVEALLNRLALRLDPFRSPFYTLMIERSPDATIDIGKRQLYVTKPGDYAEIMRSEERALREAGFNKRMATYKAQGDLFAFAMYEKIRAANDVANIRKFANAIDADLFGFYLTPEVVDTVLAGFRQNASLAIRFQKAERTYQQKLLGISSSEPWDLDARPSGAAEPRFTIENASRLVIGAAEIFGKDYKSELNHLLDPLNGRMDIVAGPNRQAGDFTWGAYGPSWVFFMQGYNGYLTDVVTLAHEATHAVHFRLLHKSGIPWYYADGARYFTEGVAKVNELLILDYLFNRARTQAERLFYLRQLTSKLASVKFTTMYWAAYATSFEIEAYRRVQSGAVQNPANIHEIWAEFGAKWHLDFDRFPDLKYTWADTHHFFDSSRYYSNYLFAWVFALAVYEKIQSDPKTAKKLVGLMKAGFSNEPSTLLQTHMGIDLSDPKALERMFAMVEKKVTEFERLVLE